LVTRGSISHLRIREDYRLPKGFPLVGNDYDLKGLTLSIRSNEKKDGTGRCKGGDLFRLGSPAGTTAGYAGSVVGCGGGSRTTFLASRMRFLEQGSRERVAR